MKKLCFTINSAGGLSVAFPIIEKIKKKKIKIILLYSNQIKNNKLLNKFKIKKIYLKSTSINKCQNILNTLSPNLVFCGNNGNNKFEIDFLRSSKLSNIKNFTIMDSWSYPLRRFQFKEKDKIFNIFPNNIGVPNKEIYKILRSKAKSSNVFISNYPQINFNIEKYFKNSKFKRKSKTLNFLYISTPYEKQGKNHVRDGSEILFNQKNIIKKFLNILDEFSKKYKIKINLTIRFHPLDNMKFYEIKEMNKNNQISLINDKKIFNYESYLEKDAVFGISSMMLYESYLCGLPSISLQLSEIFKIKKKKNYFKNVKGIKVCNNDKDLNIQLNKISKLKISKQPKKVILNKMITNKNNNIVKKILRELN